MVTTATELMIRWNGIRGVNSIASTGQTIPAILGAGVAGRVLYISIFEKGFATALNPSFSENGANGQDDEDKDSDIGDTDDFAEMAMGYM